MSRKMRTLYLKYKELILYAVFGILTTVVNWAIYFPLYNFTPLRDNITLCNTLAWVAAVLFAFVTNKLFVFESRDRSVAVVIPELIKFIGCRLLSFGIELGLMILTVDVLQYNGNWMKILVSVIVVIINYIGSKLLFRKSS